MSGDAPRGPALAEAVTAVIDAWTANPAMRVWVAEGSPGFSLLLVDLARAAGREVT